MEKIVNQYFVSQALDHAEKLFKDARAPEVVQGLAQQSVAASRQFYAQTSAAMQDSTRVTTELANSAWGNAKLLNERILQNVTANAETAFSAADAMATATSVPEVMRLQSEFMQKMSAQIAGQALELFELAMWPAMTPTRAASPPWSKTSGIF